MTFGDWTVIPSPSLPIYFHAPFQLRSILSPLHAAAHWGQREACELLAENYANMDVKNYVGQTCFDVADPGETEEAH